MPLRRGARDAASVGVLALAAGLILVAGVRGKARLRAAAASLRTSSAPGARAYDALFSRLLAGLYDRMAADALARVGDVVEPRVLEVGLGPGELAVRIATARPDLRLVGLDVDEGMLRLARGRVTAASLEGRVELVEGRVEALPFPDDGFDLVVSSFSVHHWTDPVAGVGEIVRVLRPGGLGLLYDLPDAWAHFETRTPGLAAAARAAGIANPKVEPVRWPGPVAIVRRLEIRSRHADAARR